MPIPGTKRRRCLEDNLGAVDVEVTPDDLAGLDQAAPRGATAGDRYVHEYREPVTSVTVGVTTPDGLMAVYDVMPEGRPAAAIVVIQEAFGVNSHIQDVTRRVAEAGYRAVAPHLFYRTDDPVLPYDDFNAVQPHLARLTCVGLLADFDAVLGLLADGGFDAG